MNNEMDLMQRLAVSKKIMDRHSEIKRGESRHTTTSVEDFQPINATYNLPQEFIGENTQKNNYEPSQPLDRDRVLNSKLPDEIKRLMIENPIVQPSSMSGGAVLSDELIEGATRLMKKDSILEKPKTTIKETNKTVVKENNTNLNYNTSELKTIIRDVVRDTVRDVVREELKDAGMLVESSTNTNETIQFKVGDTLFVGKITKVKKIQK